jgi:hypothetical protein
MERRIKLQEVKNSLDYLIEQMQGEEAIIIERDDTPALVIITHDEYLRLQAGQGAPDINHPLEAQAGQRNRD